MFITFTGPDGCGKSTQAAEVERRLRKAGFPVVRVWVRLGYTSRMERLKKLLRRGRNGLLPPSGASARRTELMSRSFIRDVWIQLALLDLIIVAMQVRWWKRTGRAVVCDRWLLDSAVDADIAFPQAHFDRRFLWQLLRRIAPQPDIAFFLRVSPHIATERMALKADPFSESVASATLRAALYEEIVGREHESSLSIIDASDSADCVSRHVNRALDAVRHRLSCA